MPYAVRPAVLADITVVWYLIFIYENVAILLIKLVVDENHSASAAQLIQGYDWFVALAAGLEYACSHIYVNVSPVIVADHLLSFFHQILTICKLQLVRNVHAISRCSKHAVYAADPTDHMLLSQQL